MTLDDLVDEVLLHLSGFTADQEPLAVLSGPVTADSTSIPIDTAAGFSAGLVEVGDELVWVRTADEQSSALTGVLRGHAGTTAASWPTGTVVRNNPRYPRTMVARALNDTVLSSGLWGVSTFTGQSLEAYGGLGLPATVDKVLKVSYDSNQTGTAWTPVNRWDFEWDAPAAFATGKALYSNAPFGRDLRVTYATAPVALTLGQEFSVSGLADSARDVAIYGACWRLAATSELGRQAVVAAEAQALTAQVPQGSATTVARFFLALYTQRQKEEQASLQGKYPIRTHKSMRS